MTVLLFVTCSMMLAPSTYRRTSTYSTALAFRIEGESRGLPRVGIPKGPDHGLTSHGLMALTLLLSCRPIALYPLPVHENISDAEVRKTHQPCLPVHEIGDTGMLVGPYDGVSITYYPRLEHGFQHVNGRVDTLGSQRASQHCCGIQVRRLGLAITSPMYRQQEQEPPS